MKHIGLFEGIGGFSLAARWMGWETIAWCEWNQFCQKVLNYHFPKAKQHGDITTTDFSIYRGQCDIVTGGFPCQPYSLAGKRLGKEDERHLWPHMLRAIREIKPYWVVGENVPGLINWNGGVVFNEVQTDLENEGYEVIPFVLPACGVDAPHKRDRVWFIAYSKSEQNNRRGQRGFYAEPSWINVKGDATNSNSKLHEECQFTAIANKQERFHSETDFTEQSGAWRKFPTQSPVCNGNDGISAGLDGITFSKWRNESIKAGGNSIVPQVALQIFKAIKEFNELTYGTT